MLSPLQQQLHLLLQLPPLLPGLLLLLQLQRHHQLHIFIGSQSVFCYTESAMLLSRYKFWL